MSDANSPQSADSDDQQHDGTLLARLATGENLQSVGLEKLVRGYFWFIVKNVIGWLSILASPILGVLLPGPGGIPLFLIGFALVTFPGKRRLTTRFMRGSRLPIESALFTGFITFFSVLVTAALMILVWHYYERIIDFSPLRGWGLEDLTQLLAIALLALPVTMLVSWIGLKLLNYILGWVPRVRRFVRPTLRNWGVRLLPTRRRRIGGQTELVHDEILGLEESQRRKLGRMWRRLGPWLRRLISVTLIVLIIYFLVAPVLREWNSVEARIGRIEIWRILLAVAMYAAGLFIFRAETWRSLLAGLGQRLPARATARVWALGHLFRYIPGRAYQIARMELTRPLGPSAVQVNVATRLEGALMLISAAVVAMVSLWLVAFARVGPDWHPLLFLAALLIPTALLLTIPRLFYGVVPAATGLWRRGAEARIRIHGPRLLLLTLWEILGLIWQSIAISLLIGSALSSEGHWWVIAGAWSCGWAAGHLARFAPGGIGVREIVFVAVLSVLLPGSLRVEFQTASQFDLLNPGSWQDVWWAFLFFLSLLLRLATLAAELLLAVVATAADWKRMVAFIRE